MLETNFLNQNTAMLDNIRNIPALNSFEDQSLNTLLEMSKIRKYAPGECIMHEGQSDTYLYFLIKGQIRITKMGKEVALLSSKGKIFGEMGALDSSRRSATAHAVTDVVCLATDTFYLEKLSSNDRITFGYLFYRMMAEILSQRLRQTTEEMIKHKGRINLKFW